MAHDIWQIKEHRDGDTHTAQLGDISLRVQDMDGDCADWAVHRGDDLLAQGTVLAGDYMEAARAAAWAVVPSLV